MQASFASSRIEKEQFTALIDQASRVYAAHFPATTHFERALFFSWYCKIGDCAFCFMSTQPKRSQEKPAVRSPESVIAELIVCSQLGWKVGFISGGIGAYTAPKFAELLKKAFAVSREKFWINAGALSKSQLEQLVPYTCGVVGSIETVNEEIHRQVCPSKPVQPYLRMFEHARELGLQNAMTIIIGLGETLEDFDRLKQMIATYRISKIHFYGLNPQEGSLMQSHQPPSKEYQAAWIAKTRIEFPEIDIQCGIWEDRTDYIPLLLRAGANSISKFPAIRRFNSLTAQEVETSAQEAGRAFQGSLTCLPELEWDSVLRSKLDPGLFSASEQELVRKKLHEYLKQMQKHW